MATGNVANKGTFATYSGANLNEIFMSQYLEVMTLCVTTEFYLM